MWIIGPSGPTGSPAPTAHEQEKNLTQMAGKLSTWRITVPLRKPITSGIPEPPASWQMNCTSIAVHNQLEVSPSTLPFLTFPSSYPGKEINERNEVVVFLTQPVAMDFCPIVAPASFDN